jgi:hypothetical protein
MPVESAREGDIVSFRAYSALFGDATPMQTITAKVASATSKSALVSWVERSPGRCLSCSDRIPLRRLTLVKRTREWVAVPALSFSEDPVF